MRGDAGTRVAVALCAQRHSVCGVCAWVCIAVLFMSPAPSHAWDSPNMPRPPWLRVPLSPRSLALSRTCPLSLAVARSPLSVSPPPPPPPPCPTQLPLFCPFVSLHPPQPEHDTTCHGGKRRSSTQLMPRPRSFRTRGGRLYWNSGQGGKVLGFCVVLGLGFSEILGF